MDEDHLEDLSKEDLIDIINNLEKELEEKDNVISDLSRQVERKRNGKRGSIDYDSGTDAMISELEELRGKTAQDQEEIVKLENLLADTNARLTASISEKSSLESRTKGLNKRIEELEKELFESNNRNRSAEQQSIELSKLKSATTKETQRLYEDNERLQEENKKMEEFIKRLEENSSIMEEVISKLDDEKDKLESYRDNAEIIKEELQSRIYELEFELSKTSEKLQISEDAEAEWESQLEALKQEQNEKYEQYEKNVSKLQSEISSLMLQNNSLKDSTLVGEKQKQIDQLNSELLESSQLIEDFRKELEIVSGDRIKLAERILSTEENIDRLVAERVGMEKEKNRLLEAKLENYMNRVSSESEHVQALEGEKALLIREIDELSHWKYVYESGHGLQELARSQKKLKEDNRRLGLALEQMTTKLGLYLDANGLLAQAFEKLKKECGKSEDFSYSELELSEDMKTEMARIHSQMKELESQVESLESENLRLRKTLKNQAGSFGEQGFRYGGMSAEMLVKVNEFATNLRDGKIELPLDHRSQELWKENRELRAEIAAIKIQLDSGKSLNSDGAIYSGTIHSSTVLEEELLSIRESMQKLIQENAELHDQLGAMQKDLMSSLKAQLISHSGPVLESSSTGQPVISNSNGDSSSSNITSLLLHSNEALMKEIQQLKHAYRISIQRIMANKSESDDKKPTASSVDKSISAGQTTSGAAAGDSASSGPSGSSVPSTPLRSFTPQESPLSSSLYRLPQSTAQKPVSFGLGTPLKKRVPLPAMSLRHTGPMPSNAVNNNLGTNGFTPMSPFGERTLRFPETPQGQRLLQKQLDQWQPILPRQEEDWAEEVKDLHGQLIEALEQLWDREEELEQQYSVISTMEEHLRSTKQQMSVLFVEYRQNYEQWSNKNEELEKRIQVMQEEKESLTVKVQRYQSTLDGLAASSAGSKGPPGDLLSKNGDLSSDGSYSWVEMTRKLTRYEVNENILSRRYLSLSDQYDEVKSRYEQLQNDFLEMESNFKKRIVFLEQQRSEYLFRFQKLQLRWEVSVPQEDYLSLQEELESLRSDHLVTLKFQAEARLAAMQSLKENQEVIALRQKLLEAESQSATAQLSLQSVKGELDHQLQLMMKMANGGAAANNGALPKSNSQGWTDILSELARFRGDAARLEVEVSVSRRKEVLWQEERLWLSEELENYQQRCRRWEAEADEQRLKEAEIRREYESMKEKYQNGWTVQEAESFKKQLESVQDEMEGYKREKQRLQSLLEIASQQAQSLGSIRSDDKEEIENLRQQIQQFESRSEEDRLLGSLQRQLMSTKASYRAFARKYQKMQSEWRQKEVRIRWLEKQLEECESQKAVLLDRSQLERNTWRSAFQQIIEYLDEFNPDVDGGDSMDKDTKKKIHPKKKKSSNNEVSDQLNAWEIRLDELEMSYDEGQADRLSKVEAAMKNKGSSSTDDNNKANSKSLMMIMMKKINLGLRKLQDRHRRWEKERAEHLSSSSKKKDPSLARKNGDSSVESSSPLSGLGSRMTLGEKMQSIADVINRLTVISEESRSRWEKTEQESLRWKLQVEELTLEKEMWMESKHDYEMLVGLSSSSSTSNASSPSAVAGRLVSFTEEVRSLKLSNLQLKREVQSLRQEKQSWQHRLSTISQSIEALEAAQIHWETQSHWTLLEPPSKSQSKIEATSLSNGKEMTKESMIKNPSIASKVMRSDEDNMRKNWWEKPNESAVLSSSATVDEWMKRAEDLLAQVHQFQRQEKEWSYLRNKLEAQLQQQDLELRELRELQAKFAVGITPSLEAIPMTSNPASYQFLHAEQENIQRAANVTIGSLQALLEEKNQAIDKYRKKIEDLVQEKQKSRSKLDKQAERLLAWNEKASARDGDDYDGVDGDHFDLELEKARRQVVNLEKKLEKSLHQLEEGDRLLQERDGTISQLENKLLIQNNQRERAEQRCGECLQEMEDLKKDLWICAQQLQHQNRKKVEENITSSFASAQLKEIDTKHEISSDPKNENASRLQETVVELQKKNEHYAQGLKLRDKRLKEYRDIIVRLKEEFLKSEEEKAIVIFQAKKSMGQNPSMATTSSTSGLSTEEINELRSQITALRNGLQQAKEDLEKSRMTHQKLNRARQDAVDQSHKLEEEMMRVEAQAATAQDSMQKLRRELEERKKVEIRLRDALRQASLDNPQIAGEDGKEIIMKLQREKEALAVQIQALKKALEIEREGSNHLTGKLPSERPMSSIAAGEAKMEQEGIVLATNNARHRDENELNEDESRTYSGKGYRLGGDDMADGKKDWQQQFHIKWENEKKLQKRVSTIEKRLQEKIDECEGLHVQLKRAKERIDSLSSANNELQKKKGSRMEPSSGNLNANGNMSTPSHRSDFLPELEEARSRIFYLEEVNASLRRQNEVDYPNEIATLSHQLSALQSRIHDMEKEVAQSELERKQAMAGVFPKGGPDVDVYLLEEKHKDDLLKWKRQKLEMEALLLERDSVAMENRFELEMKEEEILRLKRRLEEIGSNSSAISSAHHSSTKASSSKELELEGVVDALKKVIDKLKLENDRYRRNSSTLGGASGSNGSISNTTNSKVVDYEKRYQAEKKKSEKLESDLKTLQEKVKSFEELNGKIAQRQLQLNGMKKQLKQKDDELIGFKEKIQQLLSDKEKLGRDLQSAEERIRSLEQSVTTLTVQQSRANTSETNRLNAESVDREVLQLKRKLEVQSEEIQRLKEDRQHLLDDWNRATKATNSSSSSSSSSLSPAEVAKLQEENEKLKVELSAFDLEFFEEIENLKFSHSEAVKKLKQYENRFGKL